MKPLHFKIWMLMLITSVSVLAQKKVIFSESFTANNLITVILNLENTTVAIENSKDGEVYFDYVIEFSNYSKNDMQAFIDSIKVEAVKFENTIKLETSSISNISKIAYQLNSPFGLTLDDGVFKFGKSNDSIHRKSKDSLILEIRDDDIKNTFLKNLKLLNVKGEKEDIDFSKIKMYKSKFLIKLPDFVKIKITGRQAQITFLDNMTGEISLNLKKGSVKSQLLSNRFSKFQLDQAGFECEAISGGDFTFMNVTDGKIGAIKNTEITSEFSKIEIGEIQDRVSITDFNGEYYFYNWSEDFGRFDFFSEYSKLYLFYPEKHDYSFKVIGNNTVNHFDNLSVTMSPTKTKNKSNMMERKAKGVGHFSGAINMDMVRGILYTSNDIFIKSKK